MEGNRFNLNRTLCAVSGPVGKYLARGIDTAAKLMGASEKQTEQARYAFGQLAAFGLVALRAPEAALAIVSSTASMPSNPIDLAVDPAAPAEEPEPEQVQDVEEV